MNTLILISQNINMLENFPNTSVSLSKRNNVLINYDNDKSYINNIQYSSNSYIKFFRIIYELNKSDIERITTLMTLGLTIQEAFKSSCQHIKPIVLNEDNINNLKLKYRNIK